jgi:hypothetical protein
MQSQCRKPRANVTRISLWADGPPCPKCGKISRIHPQLGLKCPTCGDLAGEDSIDENPTNQLLSTGTEAPRPLCRELSPAEPFPLAALPTTIRNAAEAIRDRTQAPAAIGAQAVLGVAALAVQPHVDVILPHGERRPTSLFLVTVAQSGERKTTADSLALSAVSRREAELAASFNRTEADFDLDNVAWDRQRADELRRNKSLSEKKDALAALGPRPLPPVPPILTCPEPTIEGLVKLYAAGASSLGLFASEGGQFVGSYGMTEDYRLRTVSGLSALWDGQPLRRVRAGEPPVNLAGRRLSLHLQMQPGVATRLLADSMLSDQGFLSRLLVSAPDSAAGTRFWRDADPTTDEKLHLFSDRIGELLQKRPDLLEGQRGALRPRALSFSADAKSIWVRFADEVERRLGPEGELSRVRALAAKLPEHAARLAAVLAVAEDSPLSELSGDDMARGVELVQHYAGEALRLFEAAAVDSDLVLAQKILDWLTECGRSVVTLVDIYQRGPGAVRTARVAGRIAAILEEHGYLLPISGCNDANGIRRRKAWKRVSA